MKATAMDDTCSAHLEVINSHTSANEFTHPVPRIGSGPIADVGPTSFQFDVPQNAPLTVSPSVGVVSPGKKKKGKGKTGKSSPKRMVTPSSPSHSRKASAKSIAKTQCSMDDITEG
ncbi:hypothetical protein QZH41_004146 [Actinostola sp. cb2023]|nr:hypothetical protein QZH41_004146 [Actinostola sp. cb2023]